MHLRLSICLCVFWFCSTKAYSVVDSTGLKIFSNNKVFVVHKVDAGQGLYAIARKYEVTVDEIKAFNPDLKVSDPKVDQYVFIPTTLTPEQAEWRIKKAKLAEEEARKKAEQKANGLAEPVNQNDNVVYYTAKLGETLYSISKLEQCKLSVEELKKWNNLKTNSIKEGQRLIIAFRKEIVKPDTATTDYVKTIVDGPGETSPGVADQVKHDEEPIVWSEVEKEGLCTWMPGTASNGRKSYALYSGAKVGTVIRVVNISTEKVTYVRVIGPVQDPQKDDVIMVLTEVAAKRLGVATDKYFRVKISYATEDI